MDSTGEICLLDILETPRITCTPEVPFLLDKDRTSEEELSEDGDGALDAAVAETNNTSLVRTQSTCPIASKRRFASLLLLIVLPLIWRQLDM